MTIKLGLTGSIGMGKSTTAKMFLDRGCAVWDADAAVHRLYDHGPAVDPIGNLFPDAVKNGVVDRQLLKQIIQDDPSALDQIESIVHPLVHADRAEFAASTTADVAVFDIPLLFENDLHSQFDAVACVSVSSDIQRQRVLGRGTMTESQLDLILSKQMPNADKCELADYVIPTETLALARQAVDDILADLLGA